MADENLKEKWNQLAAEAAVERDVEKFKTDEAELLAAYDEAYETPEAQKLAASRDKVLADEWTHLKRVAMATFPEGARILGLSAQNRLTAVAHCFGWPNAKIAKAAGLNPSTVSRWLSRPDVLHFINEFNLRTGKDNRDVLKESISELEYLAINFAKNILRDKEDSEGIKRLKLDASKWVFNLSRDKTEDGSIGVRTLLEALGKLAAQTPKVLTPEEEAELFKPTVN